MKLTPVEGRAVWRGEELARDGSWIVVLSGAERREALEALDRARSLPVEDITPRTFPLPRLRDRLDALIDQIEGDRARGVALVRGAPIEGLSQGDTERLFWGLACHVGYPEEQDRAGARLHHVRAEKTLASAAEAQAAFAGSALRGYQTNIELAFHGDGSDALFFLCVRGAKRGGRSRVASAGAAFNELLRRDPALAAALQEPLAFDARGAAPDGASYQWAPVFCFHEGRLNMLYKRGYIELARALPGAPRPSAKQTDAMNALDSILADPDFYHEFLMRPGDIQIANNYAVLHARTAFEDDDDPARARCMMRIWATLRRGRRPLPDSYANTREFAQSYLRRRRLGDFGEAGAGASSPSVDASARR